MTANTLTAGDVVTIYADPYTREREEGEAKLIRLSRREDDGERWRVRFLSDGFVVDRFILTAGV